MKLIHACFEEPKAVARASAGGKGSPKEALKLLQARLGGPKGAQESTKGAPKEAQTLLQGYLRAFRRA